MKTDIRCGVFADQSVNGGSQGKKQRVGYGIQQKLRDGLSSAESFSFRERTGIRSGDPYTAMLPRSSGSSTHILRTVLKMSEIRLRLVFPVDRANRQIAGKRHLLCCLRHVGVRFEECWVLLGAPGPLREFGG